MLFINPMWHSEIERIGKQKCTPLGYNLHVISDILGLLGLLILFGLISLIMVQLETGNFDVINLLLLIIPFGIGAICKFLYRYSWRLAEKKEFYYDYKNNESTWIENNEMRTYKNISKQ